MEVGKYIFNDVAISGTRYFLGCDNYSSFYDTTTESVLLLLRYKTDITNEYTQNGHVAEFDLKNEKILWSKKTNRFNWIPGNGYCILNIKQNTLGIDRKTGLTIWEKDGNAILSNQSEHLILSNSNRSLPKHNIYTYSNSITNKVFSVLTDKKSIFYDVENVADTLLLIIESDKLRMISLTSGELWNRNTGETSVIQNITDVNCKEHSKDRIRITSGDIKRSLLVTGLTNALSIAMGGTSYYLIMFYTVDQTVQLNRSCSNIISYYSKLFYASRDSLYCFNNYGNVLWSIALEKEKTTSSVITIVGDNLIMLNTGFSYIGDDIESHGSPYILMTDLNYGKIINKTVLDSLHIVSDWFISNNDLYIVADNHIVNYDIETDSVKKEIILDPGDIIPMIILNKYNYSLSFMKDNKIMVLCKNEWVNLQNV